MPELQCPRCGKRFPKQAGESQVCPACSFRAGLTGEVLQPTGAVGKPQSGWLTFLLCIVTAGFWAAWVRFRVPDQLDRQHGRPSNAGIFLLSLIPVLGLPFYVMHAFSSSKRIKDYRRARSLGAGPGASTQVLLRLPGILLFVGVVVCIYLRFWDADGWKAFTTFESFKGGFEQTMHRVFDGSSIDNPPAFGLWSLIAVYSLGVIVSGIAAAIQVAAAKKLWAAIQNEQAGAVEAPPASP